MASHYAVLGLTPDASQEDISRAYLAQLGQLQRMAHGPAAQALHAELDQAFDVLYDPKRREAYDAGHSRTPPAAEPEPAAPIPVAPPASPAEGVIKRFEFVGEGGAYFRIWIVNLLLSIVTLGVYSAWAKVRREQFFHRNLLLDNAGFDYHAKPMAILRGRGIAVVALIGVMLCQELGPVPYVLSLLAITLATPWLLLNALRFRAANTSYRGLRYHFDARTSKVYQVFLGYGLLSVVTLGLAFPLQLRAVYRLIANHLSYGSLRHRCEVPVGALLRYLLPPIVVAMLVCLALLAVWAGSSESAQALSENADADMMDFSEELGLYVMALIPLWLMFRVWWAAAKLCCRNVMWNHTQMGPHRFYSALPVGEYLVLQWVNSMMIGFSLGLLTPFARVRDAQFQARYLALNMQGSLDDVIATAQQQASAVGDEMAEAFALDTGL